MKVQIIRKLILLLSSFFLTTFLVGCFGGGIDPKDDPVQPSGNANAASADDEEAPENNAGLEENGGNNAAGNNLGGGNNNNFAADNNGGKDGEAINNAADDDFLNGNNANANIGGAANGQANMFGNNPNGGLNNNNLGKNNNLGNNNFGLNTGDGDGALVNGADSDILGGPDVDKGATDDTLTNAPEGNVLAPVAENPTGPAAGGASGTGVVRYVTPGGSKLYDKPNGDTKSSLEQGDHPLVNEEGEWARTSDGYYVPSASLTAAPIPRLKQPKEWR